MSDMLESLRLLHYRAQPGDFDRTRTYTQPPISGHGKPDGYWVSVAGEDDWPAWCTNGMNAPQRLAVAYEVRLSASANIRLVTSVAEIDAFHHEFAAASDFDRRYGYGPNWWGIDWASVTEHYDGIIIAPYLWARRLGETCGWYYTWDCASGCIWNLSAIESVTVCAEAVAS